MADILLAMNTAVCSDRILLIYRVSSVRQRSISLLFRITTLLPPKGMEGEIKLAELVPYNTFENA
jgi:hypothetical protein